ncbi:S24 family peptidase [Hydrogenophaga sp.]|uniref:S24 family peptidase n=1 Tax=Hydrogenophaga sp. TaxID=1904254 RepID=UPI002732437E|nr:S24 family peptidase [Hydrogenophaga sp.]
MGLADRIKEAMGDRKPGAFAKETGVSPGAVTQWLDGSTKTLKAETAEAIEAVTGYSWRWLTTGKGQKFVELDMSTVTDPPAPKNLKRVRFFDSATVEQELIDQGPLTSEPNFVPVVGMAKLGDNGYYEEINSTPGDGDGTVEAFSEDPGAYALRVRGDSMFPAIRDGWYVVVEPHGRPTPGEYVLVKLKDGQKMVKELIMERPESITVVSVNGDTRRTILREDIDSHYGLQPVSAILPSSKWRP